MSTNKIAESNATLLLQTLYNFAEAEFDLPQEGVQALIEAQIQQALIEVQNPYDGHIALLQNECLYMAKLWQSGDREAAEERKHRIILMLDDIMRMADVEEDALKDLIEVAVAKERKQWEAYTSKLWDWLKQYKDDWDSFEANMAEPNPPHYTRSNND